MPKHSAIFYKNILMSTLDFSELSRIYQSRSVDIPRVFYYGRNGIFCYTIWLAVPA